MGRGGQDAQSWPGVSWQRMVLWGAVTLRHLLMRLFSKDTLVRS